MPVRPRKISDIKPLFTNLAVTSQYEVRFGGFSPDLQEYLRKRGVDSRFIGETVGLLCNSASLPGSSFATADINGNFTGLMEKFAHTRIFTPIELSFYVDKEYKTMKFLEHWMEYISSASLVNPGENPYFSKMKYPDQYKVDYSKIIKFNRDYKRELEYNFFGMFPIALSSVSVSYDSSQLMTVSATLNYERYVCGKVYSIDEKLGTNNNLQPEFANVSRESQPSLEDLYNNAIKQTEFGVDKTNTLNPNLSGTNALLSSDTPASIKVDYAKSTDSGWFPVS